MTSPPTPVERRYRKGVPRKVPKGRALVHNEVVPKRNAPQGEGCFQWWTLRTDEAQLNAFLTPCKCSWTDLPHYRYEFEIPEGGITVHPTRRGWSVRKGKITRYVKRSRKR
jgi:hypothetical protein